MTDSIDLDGYFPYFLGTIANRWTATSSRAYLREFGVGIAEWRVLASLAALGSGSSNAVVNLISMDPGAVSRAMARLEGEGLVSALTGRFAGRTKPFELTGKGRELVSRINAVALEREARLLAGLSTEERENLLKTMRKVMANLDRI